MFWKLIFGHSDACPIMLPTRRCPARAGWSVRLCTICTVQRQQQLQCWVRRAFWLLQLHVQGYNSRQIKTSHRKPAYGFLLLPLSTAMKEFTGLFWSLAAQRNEVWADFSPRRLNVRETGAVDSNLQHHSHITGGEKNTCTDIFFLFLDPDLLQAEKNG